MRHKARPPSCSVPSGSSVRPAGLPLPCRRRCPVFFAEKNLRPGVPGVERDTEINDPAFARACAEALLAHLAARRSA